jgi:peptide/nickel transport system permease protein
MVAFVARRVAWSAGILLLATALLFVFVRATTDPLGPVRSAVGEAPGGVSGPDASRRLIQDEEKRLGLDRPLAVQYASWLSHFMTGDWGESSVTRRSVRAEIGQRLWNTTQLVAGAILLSVAVAVGVGVISAARPNSLLDHALSGASFLGLSLPPFWFALLAVEWLVFWPKARLGLDQPLLFSVGLRSATDGVPLDYLRHLVLPLLTLALPLAAAWSRYVRASMLDVLSAPYVAMARAKGVPRRRVLVRHALRNALIPFTTVSAVAIGHLFGGVIVTETIFGWPGMGQLFYNALLAGDTNVVLPWLVVAATFVLVLVLLSDLLLAVLDPRVRPS